MNRVAARSQVDAAGVRMPLDPAARKLLKTTRSSVEMTLEKGGPPMVPFFGDAPPISMFCSFRPGIASLTIASLRTPALWRSA